jgi:hypothetical protein
MPVKSKGANRLAQSAEQTGVIRVICILKFAGRNVRFGIKPETGIRKRDTAGLTHPNLLIKHADLFF